MPETLKNFEQEICNSNIETKEEVFHNNQVINPYVIGICGGSNCGKSTVSRILKDKLPDAAILNLIHFYKPIRNFEND
jgi:pantothenate kinase